MQQASNLSFPFIRHGFFSREGGVSTGEFSSLNCGLGTEDDPAAVKTNRARVQEKMQAAALQSLYQIHSAKVCVLTAPLTERPQADALVTSEKNIAISILTADCAPILFVDPIAKVIGAAHAGWKGALGKIASATLRTMQEQGARLENIQAAIGPCIQPQSYEVGDEFYQNFIAADPANKAFFTTVTNRFHFDLPGFIRNDLKQAGLSEAQISQLPDDTLSGQAFFSHRRMTKAGSKRCGRQISAISLTD
ncbi:MAG: peptidoglycan editing factor PgeF [Dongiaceae bacterium]